MEKHGDDNKVRLLKRKGRVKNSHWALKATIITFFTSAFFSFVAESTESNGNLIVIVVLLLFLIVGNVVFDGIGIAAATADEAEVKRLSKHCGRSEKIAIYIVENADIVSNVCNDVIGDICGVISGSAAAVISARVLLLSKSGSEIFITLLLSAVVSGVTVGGKACGKSLAMNSSTAVVRTAAKVLCFFRTLPQRLEKKSAKK